MRKPNYRFERAERDRAKKARNDKKLQRQQERAATRTDCGERVARNLIDSRGVALLGNGRGPEGATGNDSFRLPQRRAGPTGLSARGAVVAKAGDWNPRPGPMSAPAAVAKPRLLWNRRASLQAAADRLVLGRFSDGYPLQWHLGLATAALARFRLLQDGVVDSRHAALQHARAGSQPAHRSRRGR